MGGIDIEVPGFKKQDGFLAALSFDAAAPSSSLSVSIFFFNISCAGTAPEGRGRTGDIKKGLLYWFITTVAQQCTIPSRRSSLARHEQDDIPTRDMLTARRNRRMFVEVEAGGTQLHGNRTLRKQDPQMLTWSV